MDKLDFQDLPYEDTPSGKVTSSAPPSEHTVEFSDFPPDATEDDERSESQRKDTEGESKAAPSMFTLPFYQQFFDVDTFDVGSRLLGSMVPNPKSNYLEHVIRPKPDLYGPFWVCATLTFSIGITGNVADFFAKSGTGFVWKYDFHKVSLAATVIFSYWLVIPLIIWGILRWRGSLAGYTLTELVCVYGYSLAIFIPCSILWLIPVTWVQLLVAIVCSLLSGLTLLITLYPAVKNDSKQVLAVFLIIVIVLHALLATGFVLYFFRYSSSTKAQSIPVTNSTSEVNKSELPNVEQPIRTTKRKVSQETHNQQTPDIGLKSTDDSKPKKHKTTKPVGKTIPSEQNNANSNNLNNGRNGSDAG